MAGIRAKDTGTTQRETLLLAWEPSVNWFGRFICWLLSEPSAKNTTYVLFRIEKNVEQLVLLVCLNQKHLFLRCFVSSQLYQQLSQQSPREDGSFPALQFLTFYTGAKYDILTISDGDGTILMVRSAEKVGLKHTVWAKILVCAPVSVHVSFLYVILG